MAEVGVGGGGGDLTQHLDPVLDTSDIIDELLGLFADTEDLVKMDVKRMLSERLRSQRTVIPLDDVDLDPKQRDIPLTRITEALTRSVAEMKRAIPSESLSDKAQAEALPRVITFPYSRHSSYAELCHLVRIFNPKDVYPCTADNANWDEEVSMENLFGQECSGAQFRHDNEMRELHAVRHLRHESQHSQTTATSEPSSQMLPPSSPVQRSTMLLPRNSVQATAQTSEVYSLRRNSQSQLRFCDADRNEKIRLAEQLERELAEMEKTKAPVPSDGFGKRLGETFSAIDCTPQEIVAVSPGSASQSLRRKFIHEGLEGQVKRARLSYDGSASSPPAVNSNVATPQRERKLFAVIEISDDSDDATASTPRSDGDTVVETSPIPDANTLSAIQGSSEQGLRTVGNIYCREDDDVEGDWYEYSYAEYDKDDETIIIRCKECGHEMWTVWMTSRGFCTGDCGNNLTEQMIPGPNEIPYWEYPEEGECRRPGIELGGYAEHMGLDRKNTVGDYLDDHSDAYDTVDEDRDSRSEYDCEDSFIDDGSIHSSQDEAKFENPENPHNEDSTTDYKSLFTHLQQKHNRLKGQYDGMMRDFVYSTYERYSSSDEELYESDIEEAGEEVENLGEVTMEVNSPALSAVLTQAQGESQDVAPPNAAIAELVLSQAQEQSQQSEVSPDRISDRVKAFEAAAGEKWSKISLISTGDNHTEVEIEL